MLSLPCLAAFLGGPADSKSSRGFKGWGKVFENQKPALKMASAWQCCMTAQRGFCRRHGVCLAFSKACLLAAEEACHVKQIINNIGPVGLGSGFPDDLRDRAVATLLWPRASGRIAPSICNTLTIPPNFKNCKRKTNGPSGTVLRRYRSQRRCSIFE